MFKELPLDSRTEKRGSKRSLVYGIGINDAPYQTTIVLNGVKFTCPYYSRWQFMFTRCYSKSWLKLHPTYAGCVVCEEWHSFMKFKQWMMTQDWRDKQLDKDILSLGSKKYSPQTCLFISPYLNSLFNLRESKASGLPTGIVKLVNTYEVGVSLGNSKRTWIGNYKTITEAVEAYIAAKATVVEKVIKETSDPYLRNAIKKYHEHFNYKLRSLKPIT